MSSAEKLKRNVQNALKLSGFSVRRELVSLIVDKLTSAGLNLFDESTFDTCIRHLSNTLESKCEPDKCIEKEHVERAIEVCLDSGYDKYETIFSVIGAFEVPKLTYNADRKMYYLSTKKPQLLSDAESKTDLFLERYMGVLQRTQRNFSNKIEKDRLTLQTVDYLLTISSKTLDRILILGSLRQLKEGTYFLEDPTGIVELDLSYARYHGGFFVENCFVLVNGFYEDKILHVSTMMLPPGEEYKQSKSSFCNLNYFGGNSTVCLRDSQRLREYLFQNSDGIMMFFSDVWLDHPMIFEKFEILFNGIQDSPPIAFIFMGNFLSDPFGVELIPRLKSLFRKLGEMISHYPSLVNNSHFVFVPGMLDPCTPHIVPRLPLPDCITEDFIKYVPKAVFTTNPCRIQYCTKEIVIFRADLLPKLFQGTINKPQKEQIAEYVTTTIISQGHLSPLSLNALPVHWDFDYSLRLYPLPHLIVVGDKHEMYDDKYKECQLLNPGPFCDSGFQFKSYTPYSDTIDDCAL